MARNPCCARSAMCSAGKRRSASSCAITVRSVVSANARARSLTAWCVGESVKSMDLGGGVIVEAGARLLAQAAGGDHLLEQRAGAVLVVAQTLVEHAQDVEADVEADQVGEGERPER